MLLTDIHKRWLKDRFGSGVRFDEPMSRHTSLRVGGPADAYITPRQPSELATLCQWCQQNDLPRLIIGNGTNLLVLDKGLGGIVISLKHCCKDLQHTLGENGEARILAGAAIGLSALCNYAIRHGIKGLNFALGIPATLGGAIMMNAGTAKGCMGDVVSQVKVMTASGDIAHYHQKDLDFGYRHLTWVFEDQTAVATLPIILEASLQLSVADGIRLKNEADAILKARARTQPLHQRSAGSFFKNPPSGLTAGELIDRAGLKGTQVGGAQISRQHANWIVNTGNATATDIVELKDLIQSKVSNLYKVELEPEVQIAGT